MRVLGPNCLGVFNAAVGYYGTFSAMLDAEFDQARAGRDRLAKRRLWLAPRASGPPARTRHQPLDHDRQRVRHRRRRGAAAGWSSSPTRRSSWPMPRASATATSSSTALAAARAQHKAVVFMKVGRSDVGAHRREFAYRGAGRLRCGVRRGVPAVWRLPRAHDGGTDRRRLCLRARRLSCQRQDRHLHAVRRIRNPDGGRCLGGRPRRCRHARCGPGRAEGDAALCVAAQSGRCDRAGVDRSAAHDELHSHDAGEGRLRHVRRNFRQRTGQPDLCGVAASGARRCHRRAARLRPVADHVGADRRSSASYEDKGFLVFEDGTALVNALGALVHFGRSFDARRNAANARPSMAPAAFEARGDR